MWSTSSVVPRQGLIGWSIILCGPNPRRLLRENFHKNKGPLQEDKVTEEVFVWEGQKCNDQEVVNNITKMKNSTISSPSLPFGNLSKITALENILVIGGLRMKYLLLSSSKIYLLLVI